MSLDDTLNPVERAKLAVWDYPVSNKYTKLWETMKLSGFPHSLEEALTSVKNGTFAYIGNNRRYGHCKLWTNLFLRQLYFAILTEINWFAATFFAIKPNLYPFCYYSYTIRMVCGKKYARWWNSHERREISSNANKSVSTQWLTFVMYMFI